jgi:hypothetical protein
MNQAQPPDGDSLRLRRGSQEGLENTPLDVNQGSGIKMSVPMTRQTAKSGMPAVISSCSHKAFSAECNYSASTCKELYGRIFCSAKNRAFRGFRLLRGPPIPCALRCPPAEDTVTAQGVTNLADLLLEGCGAATAQAGAWPRKARFPIPPKMRLYKSPNPQRIDIFAYFPL